jgi:hypothetical protein
VLLGNLVLKRAPSLSPVARKRAARVWAIRERTEHEVSRLFLRLADDLSASGAPQALVARAQRCAEDELVHAVHCREIVRALDPAVTPLPPNLQFRLGGASLSVAQRALYASVALGCVTESLSTALLLEMRRHAEEDVVKSGLDRILTDEVQHSRLGWAHLAYVAKTSDVSWLAEHTHAMFDAALSSETVAPTDGDTEALRAWGILSPDEVARIAEATRSSVIQPGLRAHGIGS